jgi:hypothetical protein
MAPPDPLTVSCPRCSAKERRACVLVTDSLEERPAPHHLRVEEARRQAEVMRATGKDSLSAALESASARALAARAGVPYSWVLARARDCGCLRSRLPGIRTAAEARERLEGIGECSDEAVAAAAGVHPESVGRIRRRLNIPRPPPQRAEPLPIHRSTPTRDPTYLRLRKYPAPILVFLREHGAATIEEIRHHLRAARNGTVAKPLGQLRDRGLVRKDEDGRWSLGDVSEDNWADVECGRANWPEHLTDWPDGQSQP